MKVFKHININPTNMNLYSTAVTHSSYTNENPSYPDYERLEFLGDAVLEIIISDYFMQLVIKSQKANAFWHLLSSVSYYSFGFRILLYSFLF